MSCQPLHRIWISPLQRVSYVAKRRESVQRGSWQLHRIVSLELCSAGRGSLTNRKSLAFEPPQSGFTTRATGKLNQYCWCTNYPLVSSATISAYHFLLVRLWSFGEICWLPSQSHHLEFIAPGSCLRTSKILVELKLEDVFFFSKASWCRM